MEPNESFPTSQSYAVESSKKDHSTVLVTGCSGFIGSHLVERFILTDENCRFEVRCMTRNVKSVERVFNGGIGVKGLRFVHADASEYSSLVSAMTGVDIAFFLIHSMEGSSEIGERIKLIVSQ